MRYKLLKTLLFSLSIVGFLGGPIYAQNIYAGSEAFESGDFATALSAFRPLAEGGDALAQYYLGVMYEDGLGVPQDYFEASKWHRLSSERGLALAQNSLGLMYKYGLGVSQDSGEALRWFRSAAVQGDVGAQSNLGVMYSKGQGVGQDHSEAVKWFRKAAEQGEVGAQDSLSIAYFKGQGVRQDYVESYKWARLAAAQGVQSAIDRLDILVTKLAPGQFAETKRRASRPAAAESTEELVTRLKSNGQDERRAATLGERPLVAASTAPGSATIATTGAAVPGVATPGIATPGAATSDTATVEVFVPANGCDLAAAHPSDFLRPSGASGVSFAEIDADRTIAECESSLEQDPGNPRYQFQLARGYRKAKRHEEAAIFYRKAAEQGLALAQKSLAAIYPDAKAE